MHRPWRTRQALPAGPVQTAGGHNRALAISIIEVGGGTEKMSSKFMSMRNQERGCRLKYLGGRFQKTANGARTFAYICAETVSRGGRCTFHSRSVICGRRECAERLRPVDRIRSAWCRTH